MSVCKRPVYVYISIVFFFFFKMRLFCCEGRGYIRERGGGKYLRYGHLRASPIPYRPRRRHDDLRKKKSLAIAVTDTLGQFLIYIMVVLPWRAPHPRCPPTGSGPSRDRCNVK